MDLEFLKVNEKLTYVLDKKMIIGSIKKQKEDYICAGWSKKRIRKKTNSYEESIFTLKTLLENENEKFLKSEELKKFDLPMLEHAETFLLLKDSRGVSAFNAGFHFLDGLKDSVGEFGMDAEYVINLSGYRLHILDYNENVPLKYTPKILKLWDYFGELEDGEKTILITLKFREENDSAVKEIFDYLANHLCEEKMKYSYQKKETVYERIFEFQVEVQMEKKGSYVYYIEVYLKDYEPQKTLKHLNIRQIAMIKNINITSSVFYEKYGK